MSNIDWSKKKSAAEIENTRLEGLAAAARLERDNKIAKTDFYLLPDAPEQPVGLLAYRQALRDITEQAGFPETIVWPEL
jgi:hypothetical protein